MIGNGKAIVTTTPERNFTQDAFGRFRVSNPFTVFNSKFEYGTAPHLWWEVDETGSPVTESIHLPNESAVNMPIAAVAGAKLIRQTKTWFPYQPGNSQRVLTTGVFGTATAGIRKQFGYFSENDGVFLRQREDGQYSIVLRSSASGTPAEREILQSAWNQNSLSSSIGTNPSGIDFDFEKSFIQDMDLEWLGVGDVRVGLNIGERTVYLHRFDNAGILNTVYMQSASLPVRYEIHNITGVNTGSLKQICQTVKSEGGGELYGFPQTARTGYTAVSLAVGVTTPILAVRPFATFGGKPNRVSVTPISFSFAAAGSADFIVIELRHESTIAVTGGTGWARIDTSSEHGSASEFVSALDTTFTATGGHVHKWEPASLQGKAGGLQQPAGFVQNIYLNRGYDSTVDADAETYVMFATAIGQSATIVASISIAEIY